jgi:hypothetical protein
MTNKPPSPSLLFLRDANKDHDVVYDCGGKTEQIRGKIIDLDNHGYVEVEDSSGRRYYVSNGKVIVIREIESS